MKIMKNELFITIDKVKNIYTIFATKVCCTYAEFTKVEDFKNFIKENNLKLKYNEHGGERKHYMCISEGEI